MKVGEIPYRIRSIPFLLSVAHDLCSHAWHLYSRSSFAELYRMVRPYTVCSDACLRGLHRSVQRIVAERIPGDVVECGTARGGSAALLGLALKELGENRILWIFDTFEGLPLPSDANPDLRIAKLYTGSFRADFADVSALFDRLGLGSRCRLVKGLFADTLPACPAKNIALLHIDCDWYESVKICLERFYDRVSPGGIIQFDDYGHWAGARKAIDEFLSSRSIQAPLRRLDYSGRQLTKA